MTHLDIQSWGRTKSPTPTPYNSGSDSATLVCRLAYVSVWNNCILVG